MFRKKIRNTRTHRTLEIEQGYEADSLEVGLTVYGARGRVLGRMPLDQRDLRTLMDAIADLETQPAGCNCSSVWRGKHYPVCRLWLKTQQEP